MVTMVRDKVREILRRKEWTQGELAHALGVAQSTVNRWLQGAKPGSDNWLAIERLYRNSSKAVDTSLGPEHLPLPVPLMMKLSRLPDYQKDRTFGLWDAILNEVLEWQD